MCCFTVFYVKEGGKLGFEDAIDKLELLQYEKLGILKAETLL
jgi:hypothetical protein